MSEDTAEPPKKTMVDEAIEVILKITTEIEKADIKDAHLRAIALEAALKIAFRGRLSS